MGLDMPLFLIVAAISYGAGIGSGAIRVLVTAYEDHAARLATSLPSDPRFIIRGCAALVG